MDNRPRKRESARLTRQFMQVEQAYPKFGHILRVLRKPGWSIVRLPVGGFFIAGSFLAILPIFGLWMLPIGLLLLAVDVPALRRPVASGIIRLRRRYHVFRNR